MPCTYIETRQEIKQREREALKRAVSPFEVQAEKYKAEADKVTRLLCNILTELEETYGIDRWYNAFYSGVDTLEDVVDNDTYTEIDTWWQDHKKRDRDKQDLYALAHKLGYNVSKKKS